MKKIVVTGAAGFIGSHFTEALIESGSFDVLAIDSFTPAYDSKWCFERARRIESNSGVKIKQLDLSTAPIVEIVDSFKDAFAVIHLAAWPGVRTSQINPDAYSKNNINAFCNVLEAIKISKPHLFMFASSSSIYGDLGVSGAVKEEQATGKNLRSYYAATKWANEILAKSHHAITAIPTVALRFFTVYGEYGRPDMAYWTFAKNIIQGEEVQLYGETGGSRNFTYINDTVEILLSLLNVDHKGFEAFNVSAGEPSETINLLNELSINLALPAKIEVIERPDVDVEKTWADLKKIQSYVGTTTVTPLSEGISRFSQWFLSNGAK